MIVKWSLLTETDLGVAISPVIKGDVTAMTVRCEVGNEISRERIVVVVPFVFQIGPT